MKTLEIAAAVFAVAVCGSPGRAQAEDPKNDSITVLPSTNAQVSFSSAQKRASVELTYLFRESGLRFAAKASAPIDEDSQIAAFTQEGSLANGVSFLLQLGYDSTWGAMALTDDERQLADLHFCDRLRAATSSTARCLGSTVDEFGKNNPTSPLWLEHLRDLDRAGPGTVSVTGIPYADAFFYSIGGDLSYSYARISAFKNDLAAAPEDFVKYDFQAGPNLTLYWASAFAFNVRGGLELQKNTSAKKAQRCEDITSSSATVSGKACSDVLVLKSADVDPVVTEYARISLTYASLKTFGDYAPGAEVRAAIEGMGNASVTAQAVFRATVFLSPPAGPLAARFGVGAQLAYALEDGDGGRAGDAVLTPFVFVGATPEALASSSL